MAAQEAKRSSCSQAIPQACLAKESGPKEQVFQIGQSSGIGQHLNVLVAWQCLQCYLLFLVVAPGLALQGTLQVHSAIAITKVDFRFSVWEALIVEGVWRGNTSTIEAMQGHTRWHHGFNEPLRVLPHEPAIFKANVLEEPAIVAQRVVGRGCVYKDLLR